MCKSEDELMMKDCWCFVFEWVGEFWVFDVMYVVFVEVEGCCKWKIYFLVVFDDVMWVVIYV